MEGHCYSVGMIMLPWHTYVVLLHIFRFPKVNVNCSLLKVKIVAFKRSGVLLILKQVDITHMAAYPALITKQGL